MSEDVVLRLKIPTDLSHSGESYWKDTAVDGEIAPLVKALQDADIDMRGSCSGHGKREGHIALQDGRILLILDKDAAKNYIVYSDKLNVRDYINQL